MVNSTLRWPFVQLRFTEIGLIVTTGHEVGGGTQVGTTNVTVGSGTPAGGHPAGTIVFRVAV
jgi:hypothetical protein